MKNGYEPKYNWKGMYNFENVPVAWKGQLDNQS